jgi:hypothetical protein
MQTKSPFLIVEPSNALFHFDFGFSELIQSLTPKFLLGTQH